MLGFKQITPNIPRELRQVWRSSNANLRRWHRFNGSADLHQETSSPRHLPMSELVFQVAKYLQLSFGLYEQILKSSNPKLL